MKCTYETQLCKCVKGKSVAREWKLVILLRRGNVVFLAFKWRVDEPFYTLLLDYYYWCRSNETRRTCVALGWVQGNDVYYMHSPSSHAIYIYNSNDCYFSLEQHTKEKNLYFFFYKSIILIITYIFTLMSIITSLLLLLLTTHKTKVLTCVWETSSCSITTQTATLVVLGDIYDTIFFNNNIHHFCSAIFFFAKLSTRAKCILYSWL